MLQQPTPTSPGSPPSHSHTLTPTTRSTTTFKRRPNNLASLNSAPTARPDLQIHTMDGRPEPYDPHREPQGHQAGGQSAALNEVSPSAKWYLRHL